MAANKYCLKWTNIYSGETGFVGRVMKSKGHFVNSADISGAKSYKSAKEAETDIEVLAAIGEAVNNSFSVVSK